MYNNFLDEKKIVHCKWSNGTCIYFFFNEMPMVK